MKAIAGAAPRGDSLLAQLGLHQLDDVLEGGLVHEAVEEELHRPAPQLAVAAPGRRGDGQHLRRCRPGGGRRLEEADVDEVALCVDDVPQALRRGPDDANQEVVVGSVRLGRADELEELGVVGADLLVRRERAGAEDRAQTAGELVREPEPLDELGLRLREKRDRVRRELVDEVERDAPVADRLADGLEGDAGGGEREHEADAPHVARPKAAVLRAR